jgi:hypothetical protein
MTRKDYEALALAMVKVRPPVEWEESRNQWERGVVTLAEALKKDNARFDSARFFDVCAK